MADLKTEDYIYALDIGTRSVVGAVGIPCNGRVKILALHTAEHDGRTMMDGQIDNIDQVAKLARSVTESLEEELNIKLKNVCVAAAGRSLRTQVGHFTLTLDQETIVDDELIGQLESGAVSDAEKQLQDVSQKEQRLYLIGYSVSQYQLDHYPLSVIQGHKGQVLEVCVVATFLPAEVIDSLYSSMQSADLQVSSMTLEPIAAMNAAIPSELRLLNLAMVDIGAGTTDIAICQSGSIIGYTMATIAGDEITEAIMQQYLVDFATAELLKRNMSDGKSNTYTDILGFEHEVDFNDLQEVISQPMSRLAEAIAQQILELNHGAPSAVFLAGGGSKLSGLKEKVALALGIDCNRVATTGNNFIRTVFSEELDLVNPEYTTPLGILVSVGLNLLNNHYLILLNGEPAKLFRSGVLTIRDVLMMNGYRYQDMIGANGKSLIVTLNGKRVCYRGEPAVPAILKLNDRDCSLETVVQAGDKLIFSPAVPGKNGSATLAELLNDQLISKGISYNNPILNNRQADLSSQLASGDEILILEEHVKDCSAENHDENPHKISIFLNNQSLDLDAKKDGQPYFLMDLLEYSGIDFKSLERPVKIQVNGKDSYFQEIIQSGDQVTIECI